jgi:transposase
MKEVRLGIDVARRADHRASLADERGEFIWSSWKFRTTTADLERLWAKIPDGASVRVILEPTRNAWVPLSAWLQARGATVVLVPAEQSADLRDYYNKNTKTDRLDSRVLARLPLLHPEGLRGIDDLGPAQSLRRAVRHRFSLVTRRSAASLVSMHWSNGWDRVGPTPSDRRPRPRPRWSSGRNTPIHGRSSVSGAVGSPPC